MFIKTRIYSVPGANDLLFNRIGEFFYGGRCKRSDALTAKSPERKIENEKLDDDWEVNCYFEPHKFDKIEGTEEVVMNFLLANPISYASRLLLNLICFQVPVTGQYL